ncbi:Ms5788A family Cys-rich leader peptide [Mycobacteroides saopaulense]|uniref:Ms5788A family Cys-rich leader peptide n=1 Tax=Mycobacteroides saopaulense TaxID=1578165 RepID=UPI003898FF03
MPPGGRPIECPEYPRPRTCGLRCRRSARPIQIEHGKLVAVQARLEPMLTKRRAVDLCRVAGCCCCCC